MINQHANFIVDLNLDKIQWQLPCGNHMVFKDMLHVNSAVHANVDLNIKSFCFKA